MHGAYLKQHFTIHYNNVPQFLICEGIPLPPVLMVVQRCLPENHPTTQQTSSISCFRTNHIQTNNGVTK